ncbi:hypothetical protein Ciccas_010992 [Cichlidogyrus casuarinus]|uniref:Cyclic nucleotide-binding domain-containing protein n=1 Tax=Cichlidogyrus casuarinus TaxID=1844966 RepID=A0ABD2PSJ4_9PLAT
MEIRMENGEEELMNRSSFGNFIGKLGPGQSFGELALINQDCIRNASIVTDSSCDLLAITRELYNRGLRVIHERDLQARWSFVRQCQLFSKWPNKYKKQAVMSLKTHVFSFDCTIISQGDPIDGLLFLLEFAKALF